MTDNIYIIIRIFIQDILKYYNGISFTLRVYKQYGISTMYEISDIY